MRNLIIILSVMLCFTSCEIYPRNTMRDCKAQCPDSEKMQACEEFCACIHTHGHPLHQCLDAYDAAPKDSTP